MKGFPPGPPGHWLLGHLRELGRDRLGFLRRCADVYGDVVFLRYGRRPVYLLSHPDHLEYVLVANPRRFVKSYVVRLLRPVVGDGLLTSEGDFWLRQRRLAQPAFHKARLATYGDVMVGCAQRVTSRWRDGESRDIHAEMMRLTLDIVARTLFGAEVEREATEVAGAMHVLMAAFARRRSSLLPLPLALPTPGTLRLRRAVAQLDAVIYRIIARRRATGEDREDLLSLLLRARDEGDGTRMTDRQLRDEVMTLFLAGHETTATALSWTWYLLAQHPAVAERLEAELDEVLAGRAPTVAELPRLRYAELVLLESMRLYPPAHSISREALQDCEIGGYPTPRGTTLLMSQWVLHRDPRHFPEADRFQPERWAGGLAERLPRFAYFPFGGGPRVCIGSGFAMMEATLLLATIAQRFRLGLVPGVRVRPDPSVTLRPVPGMPMIVRER